MYWLRFLFHKPCILSEPVPAIIALLYTQSQMPFSYENIIRGASKSISGGYSGATNLYGQPKQMLHKLKEIIPNGKY